MMATPKPSAEEFQRCRWDVPRFAEVYLGIRLHPGQRKMAEAYMRRNETGWRALYLWLFIAAGNRAGKTLALSIVILHSCVYRMGLKPPEDITNLSQVQHWGRVPYHHWHFAVEQAPAEQVFSEIAHILGGHHPAQKEGCPWAIQMGEGDMHEGARRIAEMTEGPGEWCTGPKDRGEYMRIKLSAELGGAEIHFRSTKAKALSGIGQSMNGVSFDEAGLESNLDWLIKEVLHARRINTGGQFILISTASVDTSSDFQDYWETGDPENPFRQRSRFSMQMSTRDNIGYGVDADTFNDMIEGMDDDWIAQNIDGKFIQAKLSWFNGRSVDAMFKPELPEHQDPEAGCVYIQALDPGLKDKCWSLAVRVLPDGSAIGVNLERQPGKQTTRGIVRLGKRIHHEYEMTGKAWTETGVDSTALGGHMFRELLEEDDAEYKGIPVKTVEFGGVARVKRQMLSDLKTLIDEGKIRLPASGPWRDAYKQMRNYKLLDRKVEQDIVMALAIIAKLLRAAPRQSKVDATPFSFYDTGRKHQAEEDGINSRTIRRSISANRMAARFPGNLPPER